MHIVLTLIALFSTANAVSFLATGDWGGTDVIPYYTDAQKSAGSGMDFIAASLKSTFVLGLGDNIYHSGIDTNEYSTRFQTSFEDVYTGDNLQVPWYFVFGNHDYEGNTTAQIYYSNHSSRWTFPDNYYSLNFADEDGTTLDIIMIDTVDLASSYTVKEGENGYFDALPRLPKSHAVKQWTWIEDQMSASTADYLIVAGHYPVWSVCSHGSTLTLVDNLKPLLEQFGGHYLSGHDHCLEHFQETDSSVNYVLAGLGVECCYDADNTDSVPADSLKFYVAADNSGSVESGFVSVLADKTGMRIVYYEQDGNVLFEVPTIAPRSL